MLARTNQTRPDQTRPDQTRPDQSNPVQTDQTVHVLYRTYWHTKISQYNVHNSVYMRFKQTQKNRTNIFS